MKKNKKLVKYVKQLKVENLKLKLELKNLEIDFISLYDKCVSLDREICCLININSPAFTFENTL